MADEWSIGAEFAQTAEMELTDDGARIEQVWRTYQSSQQQYPEFDSMFAKLFRERYRESLGQDLPLETGRSMLEMVQDVAWHLGEDCLLVSYAERAISLARHAMYKQDRARSTRILFGVVAELEKTDGAGRAAQHDGTQGASDVQTSVSYQEEGETSTLSASRNSEMEVAETETPAKEPTLPTRSSHPQRPSRVQKQQKRRERQAAAKAASIQRL